MPDSPHTTIPLTPLRRAIAARMSEAKRSIPHFRVTATLDAEPVVALRKAWSARPGAARVSLNDLIVKASAGALMEVPEVNVQWAESALHRLAHADIAVVTAVPGGLSTPIVRQADIKSLIDIAAETRALAARAVAGKLTMDEIAGGSFSISNLGMFGVETFDAIINPPQCAILAVGAVRPGWRFAEHEAPRVGQVMTLSLSVDHRAIDGATAGAFLTALRRHLEDPASLAGDHEP